MRELAGPPAERAVQGEQVHRRVMHADADALLAHRRDEPGAVRAPGQHDLEHVPVRVLEVLERQLALERAVPALEVASGKVSPSVGKFLQMGKLPKTEARGDVGEVEFAAGDVDLHAVLAEARHALQAQFLAQGKEALIRQDRGTALGGGDVLVGMKAEGDEVAERAQGASAPARAEGLGGVFNDPEVSPSGNRVEAVSLDRAPGAVGGG